MTGDDQPGTPITARSVGGQRLIARHVDVDYIDLFLANQFGQVEGTGCVKGITQRQADNVFLRYAR